MFELVYVMHGIVFCDRIFRDTQLRFEYKAAPVRGGLQNSPGVLLYSKRSTRGYAGQ